MLLCFGRLAPSQDFIPNCFLYHTTPQSSPWLSCYPKLITTAIVEPQHHNMLSDLSHTNSAGTEVAPSASRPLHDSVESALLLGPLGGGRAAVTKATGLPASKNQASRILLDEHDPTTPTRLDTATPLKMGTKTQGDKQQSLVRWNCPYCPGVFEDTIALDEHQSAVHASKERSDWKAKQFACESCGHESGSRAGHLHHAKAIHKIPTVDCPLCKGKPGKASRPATSLYPGT